MLQYLFIKKSVFLNVQEKIKQNDLYFKVVIENITDFVTKEN